MSTATIEKGLKEWISAKEVANRLGILPDRVSKLAKQGYLTVRRSIAGSRPAYCAASVEALRQQLVKPATRRVED